MSSFAIFDNSRTVRMHKKGSGYYAVIEGLALFGSGDTIENALIELDRRYRELAIFAASTGLELDTLARREKDLRRHWIYQLRYAAIVVGCFGLMMMPLSYALSSAVERTVVNLGLNGGTQFWRGVQENLIKAAQVTGEAAEDQDRTVAALRAVVHRAEPYLAELKPIFGCSVGTETLKR
jgi:hypothetical protein